MPNLVDLLKADHRGMQPLLGLLAAEVEAMQQPGGDGDYHLMQEIAQYFVTFSDVLHHPCENRLYDVLRSRAADLAAPLAALVRDHELLWEEGLHMRDLLAAITAGELIEREAVVEACTAYIARQREHIGIEESTLLPAAVRYLTDVELREIAYQCGRDPDVPDAGLPDARFERLRRALVAEGAAQAASSETA